MGLKQVVWMLALVAAAWTGIGAGRADARRGMAAGGLMVTELRCEYLNEPLCVHEAAPRLSWVVTSARRGQGQTAYQILVASSEELIDRNEGDLWDSGKVVGSDTAQVVYGGKRLGSGQSCYWKVRAWDRRGEPGGWSGWALWEMGILEPLGWKAHWIDAAPVPTDLRVVKAVYEAVDGSGNADVTARVEGLAATQGGEFAASNEVLGGDPAFGVRKRLVVEYTLDGVAGRVEAEENASVRLPAGRIPYLRKTFAAGKPVVKAKMYATALGVYELTLNGERVGDEWFAPGWTDYRKRVHYQAFDVTKKLREGANSIGALVGPGWFCGRAGLFHARKFYGDSPALLVQLELTYEDGTTEMVVTDGSWKRQAGPLLSADIMDGETYDATRETVGWDLPGLDDSVWLPAVVRAETRALEGQPCEPVQVVDELPAQRVTEPSPGRWTFDLGQNMVGVVQLRLSAPKGTQITIHHGEMLNPDGTVYLENLRGAAATDRYICRGEGVEVWQPRFTFHGFRYVEVAGLIRPPTVQMVTGLALGSAVPRVGEFSCSDERLNQLQSNIAWGMRGNYLSIPTDCPQRDERMGWMADTQVFVPTAAYNADIAAFMSKWMVDVADAQREDGAHSDVAPVMKGLNYGTPAWADAGVIVPWALYREYGDRRILERHIDSMIRWVEWCRANTTGLIRDKARGNDYGDWLSIGADTPKDLIGTAYFAHAAEIVGEALIVLGRKADAAKYVRLAAEVKQAFVAKYVDEEGRIAGDTQCGYLLALRFDLLPEGRRAAAIERLEADLRRRDWHLSTGFVGVSHLLPVLDEAGRIDAAYRVMLQDSFPSWLFSVKHGATTIWERWDGWTPEGGPHKDISMNSFNHYAFGSCGEWMFGGIGGISKDPGEAGAGWKRAVIRPRVHDALKWATVKHRTIRGEIACAWSTEEGELTIEVIIPTNVTATVWIPCERAADVRESGASAVEAEGVALLGEGDAVARFEVGSGEYTFTAPARPKW